MCLTKLNLLKRKGMCTKIRKLLKLSTIILINIKTLHLKPSQKYDTDIDLLTSQFDDHASIKKIGVCYLFLAHLHLHSHLTSRC